MYHPTMVSRIPKQTCLNLKPDHQIAHIYVKNGFVNQTKQALENVTGVYRLLYGEEKKLLKIDQERSGDIIAISDKDKWFSYYWWYEPEKAPSFAKNVDIHRKPGYDPVELFIDSKRITWQVC